jgi:hypothetical protein
MAMYRLMASESYIQMYQQSHALNVVVVGVGNVIDYKC